jgi:hypothetical protein
LHGETLVDRWKSLASTKARQARLSFEIDQIYWHMCKSNLDLLMQELRLTYNTHNIDFYQAFFPAME